MARGEQIFVIRPFLNMDGVYQHHGIDCGDGTVVHYSKKRQETIEKTPLNEFTEGKTVYVRQYRVHYIAETVIQRAYSRLGERQYNLLYNNCEHFATWCVTGVSESQQVNEFLPLLKTLNISQLSEPLKASFVNVEEDRRPSLLNEALNKIQTVWERLQPEYKQVRQEMETWERVARLALQENREDLARRALQKKLSYQSKAEELEQNLQKLAELTDNLLQDKGDDLSIH